MHAWEAIQTSVDFIEMNLQEDISAESLAAMIGLSPFYFQRLFKRLVNRPVQEYIKLRRLARAGEALKSGDRRILDVAMDYGFSSHANFTRAFKETYGITPEEYKRNRPLLNTFLKPEIALNYTLVDEGVPLIVGDIVLEIRRQRLNTPEVYLGLAADIPITAQIPAGESPGIDLPGQLWDSFHREKGRISAYLYDGLELGMSSQADAAKGTFTYFAGGLAKAVPERPMDDFVQNEIPAGEYIVCTIEAATFEELVCNALYQAGKYLFGTWLPNHKLTTQPFSAEKYDLTSGDAKRMEIWVVPMKR